MRKTRQKAAPAREGAAGGKLPTVKLLTIVLSLAALFAPLIPMPVENAEKMTDWFNLLGVINQEVGNDLSREDAYPLLLLYFCAMVLIAAGCMGIYYRLKSAALFTFGGAVLLVIMTAAWMATEALDTDTAAIAFGHSFLPYFVMILSVAAAACSLLMLLFSMDSAPPAAKKRTTASR